MIKDFEQWWKEWTKYDPNESEARPHSDDSVAKFFCEQAFNMGQAVGFSKGEK